MNGLLGMGLLGWALSLAIGFAVGGVFFLSMKVEVEYVVEQRGPTWLLPALLYARMAFVAAILVALAVLVPRPKLAGAALGGLMGMVTARVLVSRMVRRRPHEGDEQGEKRDGTI